MYNWNNFEIILDILVNFSTELKEKAKVTELDIIDIFHYMICTVYYLFSKKVISIDSILRKVPVNLVYYVYFYPEIDEYDKAYSEKMKTIILNEYFEDSDLQNFLILILDDVDKHKKNREISYHPSILHRAIREDDIDSFQSIISKNNYSNNYVFDFSYYERIYSENKDFSLIYVAAIYGSIKIFKYLWMQKDIVINDFLLCCAISGRNYDIIHICEEKIDMPNKILYSINSHQNELTDYFIEKSNELSKDINENDSLYKNLDGYAFGIAIISANYHIVLPCLNKIVDLIRSDDNGEDILWFENYDFDLFKLFYSYRDKNIGLCFDKYQTYSRWVLSGMASAIKYSILDQSVTNIVYIFLNYSFETNRKIFGIFLDMFKEYKDSSMKEVFEYIKYNFDITDFANKFESFEKPLVTKFLELFHPDMNA